MNEVEDYEIDFVAETFAQHWPISAIARKLERPVVTIDSIVRKLGLERDSRGVKTPQKDWPSIWYAYRETGDLGETARALKVSKPAVRYAVLTMMKLSDEQRLVRWNKYAVTNGREMYTLFDAQ